jgi:16S rRNA (guanine(966)-N(2))-methyltransferase RsmD
VRIIAGQFKGRKLLAPPAGSTARPITGAAKKSLFDILGARLEEATVVDLYCGTGTMGLEALSRGARRCWFVERDRPTVARLRRNIEAVSVQLAATVVCGEVAKRLPGVLAALDAPADIAFVDPPYADVRGWDWADRQRRLFAPLAARLSPGGVVVLRTPAGADVPDALASLRATRERRYGDMAIRLFTLADQPD